MEVVHRETVLAHDYETGGVARWAAEWIKRFKDNVAFQTVALALGMTNSGGRAVATLQGVQPGPDRQRRARVCRNERGRSLECHACNAKGDVVTLLCYAVTGLTPLQRGLGAGPASRSEAGLGQGRGCPRLRPVRPMGAALKPTVQSSPQPRPRHPTRRRTSGP